MAIKVKNIFELAKTKQFEQTSDEIVTIPHQSISVRRTLEMFTSGRLDPKSYNQNTYFDEDEIQPMLLDMSFDRLYALRMQADEIIQQYESRDSDKDNKHDSISNTSDVDSNNMDPTEDTQQE